MRTKLRSKVTLLFMTLGLLLAIPAVALADTLIVSNDVLVNTNATKNPGDTGTANVTLNTTNGTPSGDTNGCNATGSNPLTATLSSNNPDVTFPSGNTATITGCGVTQTVSYAVDSNSNGGTAVISTSVSGGVPSTAERPRLYNTSDTLVITIPDIKAPTVTSFTPNPDGVTGVAIGTDVTATFSEAMDAATITNSTFTLVGPDGPADADTNPDPVSASRSLSTDKKTATLNPDADLAYDTEYTATVTTGAKDLAGNALDQDGTAGTQNSKTWSFRTALPPCTNPDAPVFQNTPSASGWFNASTGIPTPNATSATADATVKYSLTENGTYSTTAPTLGQGETTVYAKAFDSTGTCSSGVVSQLFKVDTIAPGITPGDVNNTTWRNTDLSQAFTASDGGSGLAVAADASFTLTASAESANATTPTVVSKTVSDVAGNSTTRSVSALIDKTAPVISGADINNITWRNTDLSQAFTASDGLSGLANAADAGFTLTTSGESPDPNTPVTASKTVADNAGNSATRTISALVDKTKPSLGIVDSNLASYDVCGTARPTEPTFNPTDVLSGLANQSSTWTNNTALSGFGNYTYKASATDNATNSAFYPGPTATEVKTYTVVPGAAYSGVQQPINNVSTGAVRSSFKLGSTIPVKFQLRCGTTPINNAVAKLWVSQQDSKPDTAVNETIATNSPDIGNTFRVTDAATGQYQFNLSTKSGYLNPGATTATQFSLGTYYLYISLDGLPKFQAAQIDFNK